MPDAVALTAKTVFGLEPILAAELVALGASDVEIGRRLVNFRGDRRLVYKANIWLRSAIRVLQPIHQFPAHDERSLYAGVKDIDWRQYMAPEQSLAIDPVVHNSFCTHSLFAAQLAKDAIVDQFRSRAGARPSVDLKNPDLRLNLHINNNQVTIYLDSSGDSLHKRGYRAKAGEAPLNEVLAAGILALTGWDRRSPLADIMCGSGTIAIEAAMAARNMAPGLVRREFGYMRWPDFDGALHDELIAEAKAARRPALGFPITASDLDPAAVELAKKNAQLAGVGRELQFTLSHYEAAQPPAPQGTLVINPPYDERMKVAHAAAVYRRIGDALKQNWTDWTAWIFTGNREAAEQVGLRPKKKIPLHNGPIECRLLQYELYKKGPAVTPKKQPAAAIVSSPEARESAPAVGVAHDDAQPDYELDDRGTAQLEDFEDTGDELPASRPSRRTWQEQAADFRNRLTRMGKHWKRWARRQEITCFRVYDRDLPEVPLAIDWYEGHLQIAEYVRPHDRTEIEHQVWLDRMVETAAAALEVDLRQVTLKRRRRQSGSAQYERADDRERLVVITEGGHRFQVNLSDYLDTGLFLDHRITRSMVEQEASGKRFLNLFGYTGSFTVYAAAGGAASTTTVDLSNTYLDWARENMRLNGFKQATHHFVREDALGYLNRKKAPPEGLFDLAVVDPPTFSNSKMTEGIWDVQRDHVEALRRVLELLSPGGKIYFSTNFRRFKFRAEELTGVTIREISRQTVPPDFRNKRIHRCWTLIKA